MACCEPPGSDLGNLDRRAEISSPSTRPPPNPVSISRLIFRSLQDYWFQADFSAGLRAEVHGTTRTEKDAINLRDAVRGMVGLGRLNVPENQPELLRVWDGITVDQQGRSITIHADIAQDLIDKMVQMLNSAPALPRQIL